MSAEIKRKEASRNFYSNLAVILFPLNPTIPFFKKLEVVYHVSSLHMPHMSSLHLPTNLLPSPQLYWGVIGK